MQQDGIYIPVKLHKDVLSALRDFYDLNDKHFNQNKGIEDQLSCIIDDLLLAATAQSPTGYTGADVPVEGLEERAKDFATQYIERNPTSKYSFKDVVAGFIAGSNSNQQRGIMNAKLIRDCKFALKEFLDLNDRKNGQDQRIEQQVAVLLEELCNIQSTPTPPGIVEQVWNMAITLANNECMRMSDDYNNDDFTEKATAANDCAKRIRSYIDNPIPEVATLLSVEQGEEKKKEEGK